MADLALLLENEANAEIEGILEAARAKAEATLKAAQDNASSIVEGRKRALETELQAGLTRARSTAELESASVKLSANQSVMDKAFELAQTELRNFTKGSNYEAALGKLIVEAKNSLGSAAKLEAHPNELDATKRAAEALGLSIPVEANAAIETGVRVLANGGQSAVTNTLLGRLGRAKDGLLSEVAKLLG